MLKDQSKILFFSINISILNNEIIWFTHFAFLTTAIQKLIQTKIQFAQKQKKSLIVLNYFVLNKEKVNLDLAAHRHWTAAHLFPDLKWFELRNFPNQLELQLWKLKHPHLSWLETLSAKIKNKTELFTSLKENQLIYGKIVQLLRKGNLLKVTQELGHYFALEKIVQKGDQKGQIINFPTINLTYPQQLPIPKEGCFASIVQIDKDSKIYFGLTCILKKPQKLIFETYILNYQKNCYGKKAKISFLFRYRDNYPFTNMSDLKKWIKEDLKNVSSQLHFVRKKVLGLQK